MSFIKIASAYNTFFESNIAYVEVDVSRGLHSFGIIGLADKSIEEAKDRVGAAVRNSGFISPYQKNHNTIISLTPSHIKKEGTSFDLAIALGYLMATEQIVCALEDTLVVGELTLDGSIKKIPGILPIVLRAKKEGFKHIILPHENLEEASLVPEVTLFGVRTLGELCRSSGNMIPHNLRATYLSMKDISFDGRIARDIPDLIDIKGNTHVKRALRIAATGRHNIILYGPPGSGKTMLIQALSGILPNLTYEEMLEVKSLYSLIGEEYKLKTNPPLRSPHHTTTQIACIGGGNRPRPGEITLAHRGILFLDELPEFKSEILNALRQPLESKQISILRGGHSAEFPANFLLAGTMNLCPCGNYSSRTRACICSLSVVEKYIKRIPGPFIDRIDMWVHVESEQNISSSPDIEMGSSEEMRIDVTEHEKIAKCRHQKHFKYSKLNGELTSSEIMTVASFSPEGSLCLKEATIKLSLSNRSVYRVLKVARTIADLENSKTIEKAHILEALRYRPYVFKKS